MKIRGLLIILLLGTVAPVAKTQEPTVTNAKNFILIAVKDVSAWEYDGQKRGLNTFLHAQDYYRTRCCEKPPELTPLDEPVLSTVPPLNVIDAAWLGDCKLSVTLDSAPFMALETAEVNKYGHTIRYRKRVFSSPATEIVLDFAEPFHVSTSGTKVNIGSLQTKRITVNSESMAARLAYAMDFLARSCDKTAALGF